IEMGEVSLSALKRILPGDAPARSQFAAKAVLGKRFHPLVLRHLQQRRPLIPPEPRFQNRGAFTYKAGTGIVGSEPGSATFVVPGYQKRFPQQIQIRPSRVGIESG